MVVWNPWVQWSLEKSDIGDEGECCVDTALASNVYPLLRRVQDFFLC